MNNSYNNGYETDDSIEIILETWEDKNKRILQKHLKKTKMCREGSNCSRKICNFAHSTQELRPSMCIWGEKCALINRKTNPCIHLHPKESREDFLIRTGLITPGEPLDENTLKVYSKLCKHVIDHGNCSRKMCKFAHDLDSWSPKLCLFNEKCENTNCPYQHLPETKEELAKRLGFNVQLDIKCKYQDLKTMIDLARIKGFNKFNLHIID